MGLADEPAPVLGRQLSACHIIGGGVVIIAHPDPGNQMAAIAHEPGIPAVLTGAGFTRCAVSLHLSPASGAIADHALQHGGHPSGLVAFDHLRAQTGAGGDPADITA